MRTVQKLTVIIGLLLMFESAAYAYPPFNEAAPVPPFLKTEEAEQAYRRELDFFRIKVQTYVRKAEADVRRIRSAQYNTQWEVSLADEQLQNIVQNVDAALRKYNKAVDEYTSWRSY